MLLEKNLVTISSDVEYLEDVFYAVEDYVEVDGDIQVYFDDCDMAYIEFYTPYSVKKVSEILTGIIYHTKALIEGY